MKIVSLGNRESTDPYNAQNVGTQDQIKIMANKVSFKVCLNSLKRGNKWKEKNKCETQGRRFVLDKDALGLAPADPREGRASWVLTFLGVMSSRTKSILSTRPGLWSPL
jgi:hypothetical protein